MLASTFKSIYNFASQKIKWLIFDVLGVFILPLRGKISPHSLHPLHFRAVMVKFTKIGNPIYRMTNIKLWGSIIYSMAIAALDYEYPVP